MRQSKFKEDMMSIKVWFMAFTTFLLLMRYIGATHWVTVVLALAGAREFSEWRQNKISQLAGD